MAGGVASQLQTFVVPAPFAKNAKERGTHSVGDARRDQAWDTLR